MCASSGPCLSLPPHPIVRPRPCPCQVESFMLGSAIIVCLAGLMFSSSRFIPTGCDSVRQRGCVARLGAGGGGEDGGRVARRAARLLSCGWLDRCCCCSRCCCYCCCCCPPPELPPHPPLGRELRPPALPPGEAARACRSLERLRLHGQRSYVGDAPHHMPRRLLPPPRPSQPEYTGLAAVVILVVAATLVYYFANFAVDMILVLKPVRDVLPPALLPLSSSWRTPPDVSPPHRRSSHPSSLCAAQASPRRAPLWRPAAAGAAASRAACAPPSRATAPTSR